MRPDGPGASDKTLLMAATEPAFRADVNVSFVTPCGGGFSAVDQWPDLGVHEGRQVGAHEPGDDRFLVRSDNPQSSVERIVGLRNGTRTKKGEADAEIESD